MVFYFVQRGESLYTIAKRYQTTVHAIVAANRLDDPNGLTPGQALVIPRPGEVPSPPPGGIVHLVRPGETIFHLAQRFGTTPRAILEANQIAHPEFILPGQQLVIPEPCEVGNDWPMLGRSPGRGGHHPQPIRGQLQPAWEAQVGPRPSPLVSKYERIFYGTSDGLIQALSTASGEPLWQWQGPPAAEPAAPAVAGGLLYLGGGDGGLYALDAMNGQQVWRFASGDQVTGGPAVTGDLVFFGSWDGAIYCLEAKTGALVWSYATDGPIARPVAIAGERLFASSLDGRLYAFDLVTGEMLWSTPVAMAGADLGVSPICASAQVLLGPRAFEPADGSVLWEAEVSGEPTLAAGEAVYPHGGVDLETGSLRWLREAPVENQVSCGTQVLGVGSGRLEAVQAGSGKPLWSVGLGGDGVHPPVLVPGLLLVTLADGRLRSFRTAK